MSDRKTSWIMIQIIINVREHSDSRYHSLHCFDDDVLIVEADTSEELLAKCYGIREGNKKHEPGGAYGSGQLYRFIGPFEVQHNSEYVDGKNNIETYFDGWRATDERVVKELIDRSAVLHQLLK